uniref:Exo-alpha-sialidase n=1 Tax=Eiseniibacteriota bacterium TaxID=2212470 RepID=A0A832I5N0_UNCEI
MTRRARRAVLAAAAATAAAFACGPGASAVVAGAAAAATARPRALPTPAAPGSGEPRLVATPDGGVLMSWLETRRRGGHALRFARLAGRRWAAPRTVAEGDSFFVNWADVPGVRPFGRGGLAAWWLWMTDLDRRSYGVRMSLSRDGGATWSAPFTLHADLAGAEHGFVSVAPEGDGVRAVWLDGHRLTGADGPDRGVEVAMTLHARALRDDGAAGPEEELDARVCDCCQTAAVALDDGTVLVAYRDRGPGEVRDMSLVRLEAGRWSEPVPLHADGWVTGACPVNGPFLDASGRRVVAAWYTEGGGEAEVRVALSEDGGRTFGPYVTVARGETLGRVGAALLADGSAVVTWLEGTGAEARVRARRMAAAASAGAAPAAGEPVTIARTSGMRASGFPQVVRRGDELIFAWTEVGKPSRVRLATLPAAELPPAR